MTNGLKPSYFLPFMSAAKVGGYGSMSVQPLVGYVSELVVWHAVTISLT
jgi:hypothetical protein